MMISEAVHQGEPRIKMRMENRVKRDIVRISRQTLNGASDVRIPSKISSATLVKNSFFVQFMFLLSDVLH